MNHSSIPSLCNFIIRSIWFGRKGLNLKKKKGGKSQGLKKKVRKSSCLRESREQEENVKNSYIRMPCFVFCNLGSYT